MAVTHSNLRKNIVEIVEMVYLLRKLHKNFMYCLQNVKVMTFDRRIKMLINHFGKRTFLREELRSIAGSRLWAKSYVHNANE